MAAGGALVSAPIIIHLINRMRFKRIRWAAMEFLLKSQKRNRRKLIIEQLILLALRCLLVLLAGLLLARLQLGGDSGSGSYHFVVIDDTPSMGDHYFSGEVKHTALETARDQVESLADTVSKARTTQKLRVVLLSDLDTAVFDGPVTRDTAKKLHEALKDVAPKPYHVAPLAALQKAKQVMSGQPRGRRVFHFFSDFRDRDWHGGTADKAPLADAVQGLVEYGVHVNYLDTANPFRGPGEEGRGKHLNLAVVDLKAQTAVVAADSTVEFTVGIFNYSGQEQKSFMHVYTRPIYIKEEKGTDEKGRPKKFEAGALLEERLEATVSIDGLKPEARTDKKFTLVFPKQTHNPDLEVKPEDKPEERARKRRADAEFVQVRVEIMEDARQGLEADNVRDAVVEVRSHVPTLLVEGDPSDSDKLFGDVYCLKKGVAAAASYEVETCTLDDLQKINLEQYRNVLLVNVPGFKSPRDVAKLKAYVANGGSVAFFLGDKVNPTYYNTDLFGPSKKDNYGQLAPELSALLDKTENENHDHFFPLKIDDALPPLPKPGKEEDDRKKQILDDPQPKLVFRDPTHPVVKPLAENMSAFLRFLRIDCYYRARPLSEWDPGTRQSQDVASLPNRSGFDELKGAVAKLVADAVQQAKEVAADEVKSKVPDKDRKWAKYEPAMDRYARRVQRALAPGAENGLFETTKALEDMLHDQGAKDNAEWPDMRKLWAQPKMKDLAADVQQIHDKLLYGDPLIVTRRFGRGRALAFLTSAGAAYKWNEWASGPAQPTYPILLKEVLRYLISEADQRNRTLFQGAELTLDPLDPDRYEKSAMVNHVPQPTPRDPNNNNAQLKIVPKDGDLDQDKKTNSLLFREAHPKLGVYTIELFPKGAGAAPELQAFAYNLDADAESDLTRASRDTLTPQKAQASLIQGAGLVALRSPNDANFEEFREPPPELSASLCFRWKLR
jgi:hypothetical protein